MTAEHRGGNPFDELDDRIFHRAITFALTRAGITPDLERTVVSRLAEGRLLPKDMYVLLLEPTEPTTVVRHLREEVLGVLQRNPHDAVSILEMASNDLKWSPPMYDTTRKGRPDNPVFRTAARVSINNNLYFSGVRSAPTKKGSQQLACVSLLERITGINDKPTPQKPLPGWRVI